MTITHTDVHEARAKFFIKLFDDFQVSWSGLTQEKAQGLAEGEPFYLVEGRFEAEDETRREAFLAAIGAALVFLIDWNKARKALRKLIGNSDAVRVLDWGARHEIGHRAFLELGGAELVAAAVRHATPTRIGFGEELGAVLGREAAVDYLRTALRLSTEALRKGRTARSVREALEAELVGRLERIESTLLTTVVRQMGLARDIAVGIREALAEPERRQQSAIASAARAQRIEKKADGIAVEARGSILRSRRVPRLRGWSIRPKPRSTSLSRRPSSLRWSSRRSWRLPCKTLSPVSAMPPSPAPRPRQGASKQLQRPPKATASTVPTRWQPRTVSPILSMSPTTPSAR